MSRILGCTLAAVLFFSAKQCATHGSCGGLQLFLEFACRTCAEKVYEVRREADGNVCCSRGV